MKKKHEKVLSDFIVDATLIRTTFCDWEMLFSFQTFIEIRRRVEPKTSLLMINYCYGTDLGWIGNDSLRNWIFCGWKFCTGSEKWCAFENSRWCCWLAEWFYEFVKGLVRFVFTIIVKMRFFRSAIIPILLVSCHRVWFRCVKKGFSKSRVQYLLKMCVVICFCWRKKLEIFVISTSILEQYSTKLSKIIWWNYYGCVSKWFDTNLPFLRLVDVFKILVFRIFSRFTSEYTALLLWK